MGALKVLGCFALLSLTTEATTCLARSSVRTSRIGDDIRQVLAEVQIKEFQASELGDIPRVLAILLAKTKFSGHLNVNGKLEDSALNVYVLAPNLRRRQG